MSKTGAFSNSAMASAKRLVLPVREMYRTQAFMPAYSSHSSYNFILSRFTKRYVVHRKARYAIISRLKANSEPTFNTLKRSTLLF
jgi:hypothetical protein